MSLFLLLKSITHTSFVSMVSIVYMCSNDAIISIRHTNTSWYLLTTASAPVCKPFGWHGFSTCEVWCFWQAASGCIYSQVFQGWVREKTLSFQKEDDLVCKDFVCLQSTIVCGWHACYYCNAKEGTFSMRYCDGNIPPRWVMVLPNLFLTRSASESCFCLLFRVPFSWCQRYMGACLGGNLSYSIWQHVRQSILFWPNFSMTSTWSELDFYSLLYSLVLQGSLSILSSMEFIVKVRLMQTQQNTCSAGKLTILSSIAVGLTRWLSRRPCWVSRNEEVGW